MILLAVYDFLGMEILKRQEDLVSEGEAVSLPERDTQILEAIAVKFGPKGAAVAELENDEMIILFSPVLYVRGDMIVMQHPEQRYFALEVVDLLFVLFLVDFLDHILLLRDDVYDWVDTGETAALLSCLRSYSLIFIPDDYLVSIVSANHFLHALSLK